MKIQHQGIIAGVLRRSQECGIFPIALQVRMFCFFILIVSLCVPKINAQETVATKPKPLRPNVVIILADDLGYGDLSCFGHQEIKTPNIDQLASQGWRCTHFYAAAPMCSPSRAGLLTGRSPHRTGVYDWIAHDGSSEMHLPKNEITFPTLLQKTGYQTALHGKWHLNSRFNSDIQPQPDDHGFAYWFATQFSPRHLNPPGFVRNGKKLPNQKGYACQIVVDDAIDWLKNQRNKSKPFFQFVSFHEPHHPVMSPSRLVNKHFGKTTDNKNEAIYFANVENLDAAVGRYVKCLADLKLANNTLVIFTSDHGPQSLGKGVFRHSYGQTSKLRGRKRYLWEGGIRVPTIIRWPEKISKPAVQKTPLGFVDLLPTLATLCEYETPTDRAIDGDDFSPLLAGKELSAKKFARSKPLHWHFYSPLDGPQSVIRDKNWVFTAKWNVGKKQFANGTRKIPEFEAQILAAKLESFQLFDINSDPEQKQNVADRHPHITKQLKSKLIKLHHDVHNHKAFWSTPKTKSKNE